MKRMRHPNFKDVIWVVLSVRRYSPGFTHIKFFWAYPKNKHRNYDVNIFSKPDKIKLTDKKWQEFIYVTSDWEQRD